MNLISHPHNDEFGEKLLISHLEGVANSASRLIQELSLNLTLMDKEHLVKLAYLTGLMHDVAKASSFFQSYIRGGPKNKLTHHSLASAIFAFLNLQHIFNCPYSKYLAFKAIQKHHGDLSAFFNANLDDAQLINDTLQIYRDMQSQIQKDAPLMRLLKDSGIKMIDLDADLLQDIAYEMDDFEPKLSSLDDQVELFLIQNLLFSVLTMGDKHDAARLNIEDNSMLIEAMNYSPDSVIAIKERADQVDAIRNELRQHITSNPAIGRECHLYAMSAPTGSGKTFASLAFAQKLNQSLSPPRRVIYCLPYTSIIDQNYEELQRVLDANHPEQKAAAYRYLIKHHHLSDFFKLRGEQDHDYRLMDYLNDAMIADSWGSACIVSTFVQFFHSVIGSRNGTLRKLHNIINAIVILDEVQSLPPEYYLLIRTVFRVLATRFDTYFMTSTATQPFIFEPGSYVELTEGLELDKRDIFNRVKLHIHPQKTSIQGVFEILEDIPDWSNGLFVMNTKASAIGMYNLLKSRADATHQLFCLTTWHIPNDRKRIIKEVSELLKNGERMFLVSTQMIEAGVDLSFAKVVRDMGPLDSIIQVAGRCNRHNELGILGGQMHLFRLEGDRGEYAKKVYNHYLLAKTEEMLGKKTSYESRDFATLCHQYYMGLDLAAKSRAILDAIKILNYDQDSIKGQIPVDRFRLIEESYANQAVYVINDDTSEAAIRQVIMANETKHHEDHDVLRLSLKKAYRDLSAYSLSLSAREIAYYAQKANYFNKLKDYIYYIERDHHKNAYSPETGFLIDPFDAGACQSF